MDRATGGCGRKLLEQQNYHFCDNVSFFPIIYIQVDIKCSKCNYIKGCSIIKGVYFDENEPEIDQKHTFLVKTSKKLGCNCVLEWYPVTSRDNMLLYHQCMFD